MDLKDELTSITELPGSGKGRTQGDGEHANGNRRPTNRRIVREGQSVDEYFEEQSEESSEKWDVANISIRTAANYPIRRIDRFASQRARKRELVSEDTVKTERRAVTPSAGYFIRRNELENLIFT